MAKDNGAEGNREVNFNKQLMSAALKVAKSIAVLIGAPGESKENFVVNNLLSNTSQEAASTRVTNALNVVANLISSADWQWHDLQRASDNVNQLIISHSNLAANYLDADYEQAGLKLQSAILAPMLIYFSLL